MIKHVDVLAIGAHPDDVEMGCGGTMIKFIKLGYTTGIIDLTAGELGTRGTPEIRAQEAERGAEILSTSFRTILDNGDSRLSNDDVTRKIIVKAIRESKPRLVVTLHWFDDHPDHVACAHLVKDAVFLSGVRNYEVETKSHRVRGLIYAMGRGEFDPTFIVDISNEFKQKMDSITAFASQFYKADSKEPETALSDPEFLNLFEARGRFYGKMIGCRYGEPFYSKYPPQILDPVAILGSKWEVPPRI